MHSTTLPIHPRTGLRAVGFRSGNRPIWPIKGASPDDPSNDDAAADQGDDDTDEPDGADDPTGDDADKASLDEGYEAAGDKGKQALDRMKAKLKAERDKRRTAEAELAKKSSADKSEDEQAIETVHQEAAAEATARANQRILRSEVKAAAAGKLADPADALRLLDLEQFEVDDDGEVDADEIEGAITDLVTKKPYLAAQGGTNRKPKPDPTQGPRGGGVDIDAQIAEARKSGDYKKVISLENQKLAKAAGQ